jgi:ferredoxin
MKLKNKELLVCNCQRSMPLNAKKLQQTMHKLGGEGDLDLQTGLCRSQLGNYQSTIGNAASVCVACTQEAPLFREVAEEDESRAALAFANIREKAGWSDEAGQAHPKIAALLAEAALDLEPTPSVSMQSEGVCLVYGRDEQAIELGRQLSSRLEVTVLLKDPGEVMPPRTMDVPVFKGRVKQAGGHLGGFGVNVDDYAPALPASRAALEFEMGRNNAFSECDIILDITGDAPLFPAPEKRDGYLRADPGDPAAVQKAAFEAADLVGEFEKPRYVAYDASICAHARSRKVGCTNCLDNCPTGAIESAGETVAIDPYICAGCGNCASVCPTGAATYQVPPAASLFDRLRTLLTNYLTAGGEAPVLLVHDGRHGEEMISLMARFGRGLPARVLPFEVNEVTQIGIDLTAAAFGYGAAQICVLVPPAKRREGEIAGLERLQALNEAIMEGLGYGAGRLHLIEAQDPEAVEATLHDLDSPAMPAPGSFLAMGGKRTRTMLGLRHLHQHAPAPQDIVPLPEGAPFGRVHVDTGGCTMCLACVTACPTGAMLDDPDSPWLGFNEEACVQCGICASTCPESVISLEPRLNFTDEARGAIELNRQEPFHCVRCGKPFGVESSIRRIVEQLADKHWMFQGSDQVERIMMCDDCRVVVQFETPDTPMQLGTPRRPRTTEDDLREREEARARERTNGHDREN